MIRSLYQEITYGVHDAFRTVVPQTRTPMTSGAIPHFLWSFLPFFFMAYLVRRPGTHLMRVLLLPSVIIAIIGVASRYVWTSPEFFIYNWSQCVVAQVMIGRALDFAFVKEGRLKVGEVLPGVRDVSRVKDPSSVDRTQSGLWFLPQWLYDPLELLCALRGLGWDWGKGVHVPKQTRPLDRSSFLRATLISILKGYILVDFLIAPLKRFPGVSTPHGASIFYQDLPPLQRYAVSTTIHILTGSALVVGFDLANDILSFVAVALLNSPPAFWPPVMDNPWGANSLHAFWSMHWHQLLRQTFMVYGGYPGQWLAGHTGMVLGTFLASGLLHESATCAMGRGFDHRGVTFFLIQGPLLMGERLFRKVTGRRVGGWSGRLLVYFSLFILAQPLMDSWYSRGFGAALVLPPSVSPVARVWLPLGQRIRQYLL